MFDNKQKEKDISEYLNDGNIESLSQNIRNLIINNAFKRGSYLGKNLSYVEIAIAIKLIFNSNDKIQFVDSNGDQAYRILNNKTLVDNYLDIEDAFSCAYFNAYIKKIKKLDGYVISVIDNETINYPKVLKCLKEIGENHLPIIVILNDSTEFDFSNTTTKLLNSLRTSKEYINLKCDLINSLDSTEFGQGIINTMGNLKEKIKDRVIKGGIFSDFGFDYLGPVDGHDVKSLIKVFNKAKEAVGSVLIHVTTKKGKGYKPMENGEISSSAYFEAVNLITLKPIKELPKNYSYNEDLVLKKLDYILKDNHNILVISATNYNSPYFYAFKIKYKNLLIEDSGENALMCAYTAIKNGYEVILLMDNYRFTQNIKNFKDHFKVNDNLLIILFNSSIVAGKKKYHQGLEDINLIGNSDISLYNGKDMEESLSLILTCLENKKCSIIRVNDGSCLNEHLNLNKDTDIKWHYLCRFEDYKATIISYGNDLKFILNEIIMNDYRYNLINAININHVDNEMLLEIFDDQKPIMVYSTDYEYNGLGERIKLYAYDSKAMNIIKVIGLDNNIFFSNTMTGIKKEKKIELNRIFKELSEIC